MGTGRAVAALLALAALTGCAVGCTVQPVDADGKRRSPIHIERPSGTPSAYRPPDSGSGTDGGGKDGGAETAAPPRPPARVLWSPGDSGRDVRELQARLRQVAWLFDGPTGTYDGRTREAVEG